MKSLETIQSLPRYIQAITFDGTLYWSGDQNLSTLERKNLILKTIEIVEDHLRTIKNDLSKLI